MSLRTVFVDLNHMNTTVVMITCPQEIENFKNITKSVQYQLPKVSLT